MIARLRGQLVDRDGSSAVIDVRDVGYAVQAPMRDLDAWQHEEGPVVVHVVTDVREDAIVLYGFADAEDRRTFEQLRTVGGVGPKVALSALDALGGDGLAVAVSAKDAGALVRIPGVGKKLAQRMLLELDGKLAPRFVPTAQPTPQATDLLPAALAQLGYAKGEIARVLPKLDAAGAGDHAPLPERIKAALKLLARRSS